MDCVLFEVLIIHYVHCEFILAFKAFNSIKSYPVTLFLLTSYLTSPDARGCARCVLIVKLIQWSAINMWIPA